MPARTSFCCFFLLPLNIFCTLFNSLFNFVIHILHIKMIRSRCLFNNIVARNKSLNTASDTCHHMHHKLSIYFCHLLPAKFLHKICISTHHCYYLSSCLWCIIFLHLWCHCSFSFLALFLESHVSQALFRRVPPQVW